MHLSATAFTLRSSGSVLVQLVSVPVRNLPDVSFVYGLLHLYKDSAGKGGSTGASPLAPSQVNLEAGFPLQGTVCSKSLFSAAVVLNTIQYSPK